MNVAVVLASGKGTRVGADIPKQFIKVAGKPVFAYTLEAFLKHPQIDRIVLVVNPEYHAEVADYCLQFRSKPLDVIAGGQTRVLSAYHAFSHLAGFCREEDKLVIHDAVRPFLSQKMISRILKQLDAFCAVAVVQSVAETVFYDDEREGLKKIDRSRVYRIQTPEAFLYGAIAPYYRQECLAELEQYTSVGHDLMLKAKKPIGRVPGETLNFKITTQEDLALFSALVRAGCRPE